ncbi:hypothetical protein LLG96_05210 [bacterium]|nr:hypothetical protein [bacterium]
MNKTMQVFTFLLAVIMLLAVIGICFYYGGIRKYGTPAEFKRKQLEIAKAHLDSIKAVESLRLLPENVADSTLFGIGRHTELFEDVLKSENRLEMIQALLDSVEKEKQVLADKEKAIDSKISLLTTSSTTSREANIRKLAQIYNAMKPPDAVPLISAMNDTTAVSILTLMSERNASRVLGALAEKDIEKATKINRLLADLESIKQ